MECRNFQQEKSEDSLRLYSPETCDSENASPIEPQFTLFTALPLELQKDIWDLAAFEPRRLLLLSRSFYCGGRGPLFLLPRMSAPQVALSFCASEISLMSTCRESRSAFIRSRIGNAPPGEESGQIGYLRHRPRPRIDTIYLKDISFYTAGRFGNKFAPTNVEGRLEVRHMAVDYAVLPGTPWRSAGTKYFQPFTILFPNLETVELVSSMCSCIKDTSKEEDLEAGAHAMSMKLPLDRRMELQECEQALEEVQRFENGGITFVRGDRIYYRGWRECGSEWEIE